jgi:hypothetical protein
VRTHEADCKCVTRSLLYVFWFVSADYKRSGCTEEEMGHRCCEAGAGAGASASASGDVRETGVLAEEHASESLNSEREGRCQMMLPAIWSPSESDPHTIFTGSSEFHVWPYGSKQ